jgi:hypothetical protein
MAETQIIITKKKIYKLGKLIHPLMKSKHKKERQESYPLDLIRA